jgi:hypothetical protein
MHNSVSDRKSLESETYLRHAQWLHRAHQAGRHPLSSWIHRSDPLTWIPLSKSHEILDRVVGTTPLPIRNSNELSPSDWFSVNNAQGLSGPPTTMNDASITESILVTVIGGGSTGKSALVRTYMFDQYVDEYDPTIEDVSFYSIPIQKPVAYII